MYQRIVVTALTILVSLSGGLLIQSKTADIQKVQQELSDKVIRCHVIANSDTQEDQKLKLLVKEDVLQYLKKVLENSQNIEETRTIIQGQEDKIKQIAEATMLRQGYEYLAEITYGKRYFPKKKLSSFIFPAGVYEAVQIEMGAAKGQNWWGIMYPGLCFVEGSYVTIVEENAEELKGILSEEEYRSILTASPKQIKIKLKVLEMFRGRK